MKNHKMLLGVTFALSALIGCQKQQDLLGDNFPDTVAADSLASTPDSSLPLTAGAVAAGAKRVLIDVGVNKTDKDSWGKYWNQMADARPGVRVSNAVTTLNTPTTLKLEVLSPLGSTATTDNGLRTSGANVSSISGDYPASAMDDNAVVHSSVTGGKWKIGGLTASSTYYIRFWGTYKASNSNRFVQIKRADQSAWQDYNTSNNTDTAQAAKFVLTGKTEQEFNIQVKSGSTFGYISIVDITEYPASGTTPGGNTNKTPTANAGADATISLPTSQITLKGSGTDPDGSITSYAWTKTAGPAQFKLSSATVASPVLSGLVAGTYSFRLTVKDNGGATAYDDVKIVVNAASSGASAKTLKFDSYNNAYYPNGTGLDWKPGDTIYIPAGSYGLVDLGNIRGTASQPIIITNRGGQVVLNQVRFNNQMENFKFLGNGTPGITYGIKIANTTEQISFAASTVSNMEVAYVEVDKGAIGMMIKKNPVAGLASSQYGAYTIRNIKVHHCYIHDTKTEGMYIGSTSPSGGPDGIPIRLENVEISFNKLDRTGWDGIQMSTTLGTNSIHDNVVTNFGTLNVSAQQTGIAIGSAATGEIYNNTISNGTGWGINCMGYGTMKVYNNLIENIGKNGNEKGAEAIYADDRISGPESFPKQQIVITGNTIRNPQPKGAIRIGAYNNNSLPSTVTNNKIALPNAPTNWLKQYVVANPVGSVLSNNVLIP